MTALHTACLLRPQQYYFDPGPMLGVVKALVGMGADVSATDVVSVQS